MPNSDRFLYGKTINQVLKHRGDIDDAHLSMNVEAILTEKVSKAGIDGLAREERNVYAVQGMDREINNGGLELFFFSESGALAPELPAALEAMDLPACLTIIREALRRFGKPPSWADEDRRAHLEQISERENSVIWDRLDAAYYEYPEVIEEKLLDYIENHIGKFT